LSSALLFSACNSAPLNNGNVSGGTGEDNDGEMVMCTMDAKACPDGSYVGRIGPNCEFAACPGEGAAVPEDLAMERIVSEQAMFESYIEKNISEVSGRETVL